MRADQMRPGWLYAFTEHDDRRTVRPRSIERDGHDLIVSGTYDGINWGAGGFDPSEPVELIERDGPPACPTCRDLACGTVPSSAELVACPACGITRDHETNDEILAAPCPNGGKAHRVGIVGRKTCARCDL